MQSKLINDGPQKTYVLVLDKDDEAVSSIESFARDKGISAAQLTGIGAFSDAVLGFFEWETKDYRKIPVKEQVEVVSLLGDIALGPDGKPALHPHVVVSRADGMAMGGHLLEAHVRPTLEVVLTESPRHLHKRKDGESGLALSWRRNRAMSETPPVVKTATEARQGRTTGVVRWVLGISLTLAIVGMIIAFFVS